MKNGKLGIININNMIPAPIECLTEALPTITDLKYKLLIENQLDFINAPKNSIKLMNKVYHFRSEYNNNRLPENILKRTCNCSLLEEKYEEWIKIQRTTI